MKNSFKNWLYVVLPIMIGVVILVASCKKEKEEKEDEKEKKITQLENEIRGLVIDSTTTLNQARAALIPALTQPEDIKNPVFNPMTPKQDFLDTLNYIINRYEEIKKDYAEWGLPSPNQTNMAIYFDLGKKFDQIVKDLKKKRDELKQLQGGKKSAIAQTATISSKNKCYFDNKLAVVVGCKQTVFNPRS